MFETLFGKYLQPKSVCEAQVEERQSSNPNAVKNKQQQQQPKKLGSQFQFSPKLPDF
jgi:hypothetical protein